ncbi:TetR/AcrR family transcriptional regulator [Mycetocola tolaasinivorans]|uniref:TetR/AcrR family transcriptional regulator n=1 Tax=Mycetocola tolaasinivorans TaxID=76635 RepID=A0A3L7ABB0_9MICO|nr:TetR family transcriptional regulator [Mycetocola tolaasinivorans]RLP77517.1 TetR/AcrR family transcriptional regulator [Mycetocola tolaasinivorans]
MVIQRARSSDAKAQRADDLLDAAEALALELGGVRHVTLAPVTERAGLHRTAVRRYFESKEELLLELAERGWRQWREGVDRALEGRTGLTAREVADVLTDTLAALPVFCDCLTHVALSLEGDVSLERARIFKRNAFIEHDALVTALTEASVLSRAVVTALVPAASALAASFWQISHPSPSLAELYVQEPQWGHVAYDFEPKLRLLVESTAIGLMQTLPE